MTMAENPSSGAPRSSLGGMKKVLLGAGALGLIGAAAAVFLFSSKKQTRHLTPDVEIIDKL